jgi:hypothetical protein
MTHVPQLTRRTDEDLGESMAEELLELPDEDLVELLLQVHHEETQRRQPLRMRPALARAQNALGSIAADCLDTYRLERVDIPKALKGLEEVMRAPIGVFHVEVFMAAAAHRLLSYALKRNSTQTEGA